VIEKNSAQIKSADATNLLLGILQQNRFTRAVGVASICSANGHVLDAVMRQALGREGIVLIESTSNQVNQFGGYSGQKPADFVAFVNDIARETHFPQQRLLLGGDHLGPHVWRNEPAASAMQKGCALVREYVLAGYKKIHLDASMRCADDLTDRPLPEALVSERAAMLCEAAEGAHKQLPDDSPAPLYVIGSEVPIPGGAHAETSAPEITRSDDLARTLQMAKAAFHSRHLDAAWGRVIAVVVQPGVEFGDSSVFAYDPEKTKALARYAEGPWTGVFEAHSTDYQTTHALQQMVRDHFAILKVGPWLTFAFREAVFALAEIEQEWLGSRQGRPASKVREALEHAMLENSIHWKSHYHGDESAQFLARKYSYSDRARYYWPQPAVAAAVDRLIANLSTHPAPLSLLSQYLPVQCEQVRTGKLTNHPLDLIRSKITEVLDRYAVACGNRETHHLPGGSRC